MNRRRLMWPILLVLLTNTLVLAGVSYNRSGEPSATLLLTERELEKGFKNNEDSGISLQLIWDLPAYKEYGSRDLPPNLLTHDKLDALGFPCRFHGDIPENELCMKRNLTLKAFLVLEFNGPSWQRWQEGNQKAIKKMVEKIALENDSKQVKFLNQQLKNLERAPLIKSRLFIIDMGASAESLRHQYPDHSKFIITAGLIRISYHKVSGEYKLKGWVREVLIDNIHVEPRWRNFFDTLPEKPFNRYSSYKTPLSQIKPRYQVTLKYGKRQEPWIEDIQAYQ